MTTVAERPLPRLMVAPNGARLTKADHPALPMSEAEIVSTALACQQAGADGLHLHIRDAAGRHLLDAAAYRRAVAAVEAACPGLGVQITTEARGIYAPPAQRAVALAAGCGMVSVSVRENCRDGLGQAAGFYAECAARGITVQHILYDRADAELLERVLPADDLAAPGLQLLFVLGRYSDGQQSHPEDLAPFSDWMDAHGLRPDWALSAFGKGETDCLLEGARRGGKCRIGFENNRLHADGRLARDNAERVAALVAALAG